MLKLVDDFSSDSFTALLYGESGLGKTTLAASSEKSIIVNLEGGLKGIDLKGRGAQATHKISDYNGLLDCFAEIDKIIKANPGVKRSIVIDTLTKAEELVASYVCELHKKETLADFGYGQGYALFAAAFAVLLEHVDALKDAGANVIMVAHAKVESVNDPENGSYERFSVNLRKEVAHKVLAQVDHVLFMHREKVISETAGTMGKKSAKNRRTMIQTSASGGVVAKTRGEKPLFLEVKNTHESASKIWEHF